MVTANHTGIYWNTIFLMTSLLEHRALERGVTRTILFSQSVLPYMIYFQNPWAKGVLRKCLKMFLYHQKDQGGQEGPKTGVLDDYEYLDKDYFHCNLYHNIFWQFFGPIETQKSFPGLCVNLEIIRKVQNIYKLSFIEDFGCFSFPTNQSARINMFH